MIGFGGVAAAENGSRGFDALGDIPASPMSPRELDSAKGKALYIDYLTYHMLTFDTGARLWPASNPINPQNRYQWFNTLLSETYLLFDRESPQGAWIWQRGKGYTGYIWSNATAYLYASNLYIDRNGTVFDRFFNTYGNYGPGWYNQMFGNGNY